MPERIYRRVMPKQSPRCIVLDAAGRRCPHRAARCNSDLFACTRHGLITLALIDDMLKPATRMMLARARWETAREARALIDRMNARRAA